MRDASLLRCLWLGPIDGGLNWLYHRITDYLAGREASGIRRYEFDISEDELVAAVDSGLERIVIGCNERLDYPRAQVEWLSHNYPEIPLAIATDCWWEGARRTGLAQPDGRQRFYPWHRWWDNWVTWLEGDPLSGSLSEAARAEVARCPDRCGGLIVADDRQIGLAWEQQAQVVGASAILCTPRRLPEPGPAPKFGWILWDDSCDRSPFSRGDRTASDFIAEVDERFAPKLLIVALTAVRLDRWQALERAGADELLVKPSQGRGLTHLLLSHWQYAASLPRR